MRRFSFKPAFHFRGREFRGPRGFAGKPFHPPLTDIPIGAYIIAPALDLISFFMGEGSIFALSLHEAAGYIFLAGAAVSVLTVITGFFDWLDTEPGTQMRRMINAHAWTMILMSSLVVADIVYRYFVIDQIRTDTVLAILAAAIGGLVTMGSAIGGALVYDYGFNVEASTDTPAWHKSETDVMSPHEGKQEAAGE